MAWTDITPPAQGDATKKTSFAQAVINCLTHLYNLVGGAGAGANGQLQNGSFENDVDSDGIPDGYTRTLGAGGSAAFDTTTPAHGKKAYKFTTPGSVDNYLEHEDLITCSPTKVKNLAFMLKCSAAGVAAQVSLRWYDKAGTYLSTTDIYSEATANPTSWTRIVRGATPPANAVYFKPRFYGGITTDATPGDVYFDGVELVGGVDTVSGWTSGTGSNQGNRIKIDGSDASPVPTYGTLASVALYGVATGVAGNRDVAIAIFAVAGQVLSMNLTLPAGTWTIKANALWSYDLSTQAHTIVATAFREG